MGSEAYHAPMGFTVQYNDEKPKKERKKNE
jgi:hypothetical protein